MIRKFLLLIGLCLLVNVGFAQTRQVKGTVTASDTGDPLPGAGVKIKGTTQSVVTNGDGNFSIQVKGNTSILQISYIGYTMQEVAIGSKSDIKVSLRPEANTMDEVTIIGYGVQTKNNQTGAVTSFDAEKQLKDIPNNLLEQSLVGRLAGVQIGAAEGSLDPDYSIIIRGGGSITQDNSPLYIIDGVQVEDGLKSLSPQDIEHIDVLKDASSTAIYGSRGANGVVLITTKGGKAGTTNILYNGIFGMNKINKTLDVMSPYEFVLYQVERNRLNNTTADLVNLYKVTKFGDVDSIYRNMPPVDWQERTMGRDAFMLTNNVSINGGRGDTKFNFTYTNNNQDGILLESDYQRNIFGLKLDQKASDKLKVQFTTRYTTTLTNGSGISDAGNAQVNGLRNFVKYKPFLNAAESDDDFDEEYFTLTNQGGGLGLMNPVAWLKAKYRKANTSIFNLGGNANYTFNNWLSYTGTAGTTVTNSEINIFNDALRAVQFPSVNFINTEKKTFNWSNVINYTNKASKSQFSKRNSINLLLGQEIYSSESESLENRFQNYPRGITPEIALSQLTQGIATTGYPIKDYNKSTLLSFFTRGTWNYRRKYTASFSLRADGSSKFAEDNRWGYFPSAAVAWTLSEEKFLKDVKFISNAKLRLSYGTSGNNRIPDYRYQYTFNSNALYSLNNSTTTFGYVPVALANPKLKWETTTSRNLGLDLAFFKNRLQITTEVYSNRTNDVITSVPVSTSSGYTTQLQNTANTRNQGFELQVSGTIAKTKKFSWTADFNITGNNNKILSLANGLDSYLQSSGWSNLVNTGDFIVKKGGKVGDMWGYVSDGFYSIDDFDVTPNTGSNAAAFPYIYTLKAGQPTTTSTFTQAQPGTVKIKDISGPNGVPDGIINDLDKTVIGNGIPKFYGGLFQQFRYKQFDASFFLNFSFGGDVMNANKIEFTNGYLNNNNLLKVMENRWKTVNDQGVLIQRLSGTTVYGPDPDELRAINANATMWQPIRSTPGYFLSDWAVEDGSFIRLNNFTIGYNFEQKLLSRFKIKRLRAYATVNNIAIITNYTSYDPEVNTRRSTGVTPGVDYSAYPRSRGYIFGLNLSL